MHTKKLFEAAAASLAFLGGVCSNALVYHYVCRACQPTLASLHKLPALPLSIACGVADEPCGN